MINIYNFIKRHLLYVLVAVVSAFALSYIPGLPKDVVVLLKLPVVMAVVLLLASMSHYCYTNWNFSALESVAKKADEEDNHAVEAAIIAGKFRVLSSVFIGVCVLVSIVVLGIYFLN